MLKKYLNSIRYLKNSCPLLLLLFNISCAAHNAKIGSGYQCEPGGKPEIYEQGDIICSKNELKINSDEKLLIKYIVTNKNSEDHYKHGYHELQRYKKGRIVERIKLRGPDDAYSIEVPFVRIRKQRYLSDLDGDGSSEFAILPFHPGSAIWMTARIFSLKEKIIFWGTGRYQFEGDTFVQLNCPECSKFDPQSCQKCK